MVQDFLHQQYQGLGKGSVGLMAKKMETTIILGVRNGFYRGNAKRKWKLLYC